MSRKVIHSDSAPKAIGPYSQAIETRGGRTVYLSGQIALDYSTGQVVEGDVAAQTEKVMKNLEAVLVGAGMTFGNVARCTIFLVDMNDFGKVNEVYGRYFPVNPPARATVAVAGLPRGVRVEIDAVAVGE
jgi:2-iminobutanoate/2-iminopropanoate deaminase